MNNLIEYILYNDQPNTKVALISGDQTITFGDLRDQVSRACAYFKTIITADNPRVVICAQDSIEWVVAALGVISAGGIVASVSIKIPVTDIQTKFDKIDPVLVVSSVDAIGTYRTIDINHWYQTLDQYAPGKYVHADVEDICLFFNSGGTTGSGKFFMHTHKSIYYTLFVASGRFMPDADDISLAIVPFVASYGTAHWLGSLHAGATAVIGNSVNPNSIKNLIEKHGVTCFGATPVIYSMMLKHNCVPNPLPAVCIAAGDLVTAHLRERWHQTTGQYLRHLMGTSETGLIFYVPDDHAYCTPFDALGLSAKNLEIELRDENNHVISDERPGQLWFRSPSNAIGLWNDPVKQAEIFVDGWMTTEDLVRRGTDDNYYFVGRMSEIFKIDAKSVDLARIENCSLASGLLEDVLVVPVISKDNRAHIKLLAIAKSQEADIQHRLKEYLKDQLEPYEVPSVIQVVEELPRSPAGKKVRKPEYI